MTAAELPVGAVFTVAGGDTFFTVTHQCPGREPCRHLTEVQFFNPWQQTHGNCTFAGHTEVIHHLPTQATGAAQST